MYLRYVTCNAKVSSHVVDTLRSEVPEYLHGMPHWFVRHCISRLRNAAKMDPGAGDRTALQAHIPLPQSPADDLV